MIYLILLVSTIKHQLETNLTVLKGKVFLKEWFKNYVQLVNSVLRRLRENEVTTVQSDNYSKLIGDLVNDERQKKVRGLVRLELHLQSIRFPACLTIHNREPR